MGVISNLKRLRPWQAGGAVVAAGMAVAVTAVYGASTIFGGPPPDHSGQSPETVVLQQQPAAREIPVNGRLVFPRRAELTFDTGGKVGEVLVQEGERVVQGQALARLDDLTVSALKQELAQAEFDLDAAEEALQRAQKAEFSNAPLQRAEFEEQVARARKVLEDAEKRLRDYQRDHGADLAAAMHAKADAERALDDALRARGNVDRDRLEDLANARQLVADQELALENARKNLADFEDDYQESLGNAMLQKANAEEAVDVAEDNLTAFLRNPSRNIERDQRIDVELLRRREAAVAEARTNLTRAENELSRLRNDRQLLLEERQAVVPRAEAALVKAKDDLAKLERDLDQNLNSQMRQANLEVAQAKLAQAEADLQEEMDGPDQVELAVREKAVVLAQERLNDLEGPDSFDIAVKDAGVAAARAKVDDALEGLEGATVRAPFDGVISLVNVEADDDVNDKSRVLEIIDPTRIEVDGLVDAIDVQHVQEGGAARISIASLPEQKFAGTVTRLAEEPRTERGVVSYPVRIQVDLPEGLEAPIRLSAVTVAIVYEESRG